MPKSQRRRQNSIWTNLKSLTPSFLPANPSTGDAIPFPSGFGSLCRVDLSSYLSNCRNSILGFCTLSSVGGIAALRPLPSDLSQGGPGRRQTRATVYTLEGSRG